MSEGLRQQVEALGRVLPRGGFLDDATFERRHRLLLVLLLLHIPVLVVIAAVAGLSVAHAALEVTPLIAAAAVGQWARPRLVRAAAVTLGLVGAASILVHISGGLIEAHFHFFVILAFIALYQDWRTFGLAVGFVAFGHGAIGLIDPAAVYNHPDALAHPVKWAGIHTVFVLFAAVAHTIFWKVNEAQQEKARQYYAELYEGERAIVERMQKTQTLKDELLSVVGHEFRTPLTAIQGYARPLDARLEEMEPERARRSASAIEREAKRLTRMVANLLTAAEELEPRAGDRCNVREVVNEVVVDVVELAGAAKRDIRVHVSDKHTVAMGPEALHQVLFNLLDNAVKFADHRTDIRLTSRREGDAVVIEVTNVGPPIANTDRERIFDAFVQADSSDTRQYGGIGLGLYIVRKIVAAHGGRIGVFCEGPVVIFRVWLPPAVERRARALPAPGSGSAPPTLDELNEALRSRTT